jgi:CheY-like chemotaxis protein
VPETTLVLVVEDEYLQRCDVEDALTSGGFAGEIFSSGESALASFMDGNKNYASSWNRVGDLAWF